LLGQEVTMLIDEFKQPGIHSTSFDASNLPSGVYFYRISNSETYITKKMMVIR
jgi:hypothetical protein